MTKLFCDKSQDSRESIKKKSGLEGRGWEPRGSVHGLFLERQQKPVKALASEGSLVVKSSWWPSPCTVQRTLIWV